jgi:serine/threonine protein kinase
MLTSKYSRMLPQRAGSMLSFFNGSKSKDNAQNNQLYINSIHLQRIAIILQQISSALAYLHSHSIIHFDVKLENILLVNPLDLPSFSFSNGKDTAIRVKLCDLGSAYSGATIPLNTAAQRQTTAEWISKSTTPLYKAPECVDSFPCKFIDQKVDVWAFGCVTYQLMFYQHVWEDYLGITSKPNLPKQSTRKIDKVFGMKTTASKHFNGASATSAATATFSPATPNLAILSGRYHLPPLHPVIPLVLPQVEDRFLFNSYASLLDMIRHKMLVVQPLKRSTMEEINKEFQQLLNHLNNDDLNSNHEKKSHCKNLVTVSKDDTLQTSASSDDLGETMRLRSTMSLESCSSDDVGENMTVNKSLKSGQSSPCFALQPWVESTTPNYSSARNKIRSQSSSIVARYPSEIEVVSLNSNQKSTLIEVG